MNAKEWLIAGNTYLDIGNYTYAREAFIEGIKERGWNPQKFKLDSKVTHDWCAALNYNGLSVALYKEAIVLAQHRGTADIEVTGLINTAESAWRKAVDVDERLLHTICDGIPVEFPKYGFMVGLKEELIERGFSA